MLSMVTLLISGCSRKVMREGRGTTTIIIKEDRRLLQGTQWEGVVSPGALRISSACWLRTTCSLSTSLERLHSLVLLLQLRTGYNSACVLPGGGYEGGGFGGEGRMGGES